MKIMMEVLFHYFDNLLYTHQTKGVNILNWLKMRTIVYAQMCNVQSMKKQKKYRLNIFNTRDYYYHYYYYYYYP